MATFTWAGYSGDWDTATIWDGDKAPGAADHAVLKGTASGTVSITSADAIAGVNLDDAAATLAVDAYGTLSLSGTLTLKAGTLSVLSGGTILGGTIAADGGAFSSQGGTLDGVTFEGALALASSGQYLVVNGAGLTLEGAGGTGPGQMDLAGGSKLLLLGTQSLNNATIDLGGYADVSRIVATYGADTTFGANLLIDQTGQEAYIGSYGYAASIINKGTIEANYAGAGGTFSVDSQGTFINAGTIIVGNGETFTVGSRFASTGLITLSSGGVIDFDVALVASKLGDVSNTGGTIEIGAALNNAGVTLATGAGAPLGTVILDKNITITGGTISDTGGGFLSQGGTLNGVTFEGALDLASSGASLTVTGAGITLTGVGGVGAGQVNLGDGDLMRLNGTQSLNYATINIGGYGGSGTLLALSGATVTLGPGLLLDQAAKTVLLEGAAVSSTILNLGTIEADDGAKKSRFEVSGKGVFTNAGTILVGEGDELDIDGPGLSNATLGQLAGGVWSVGAGSTLILPPNDPVYTDAATIILSGAGSVIESLETYTSSYVTIDGSLTSITSAGALELLAGRDWSSGALASAGTIVLGGGTLDVTALTSSGVIDGYGTVTGTLVNKGVIQAAGGQALDLSGASATLQAGTSLIAGAGDTIVMPDGLSLATLGVTVELRGAGSEVLSSPSDSQETLEQTLTSISAKGELGILDGRDFTSAYAIANAGMIDLGGGTLSTGVLINASGGTLIGFGTIASQVTDKGLTYDTGGRIDFTGTGDVFSANLAGYKIDFAGGTDLLSAGSALNMGLFGISGGAVVTFGAAQGFAGNWTQTAATVDLAGYRLTNTGTIDLESGAVIAGYAGARLVNDVMIIGGGVLYGTMSISNSGFIDDNAGAMLINNQYGAGLANSGQIESAAGYTLTLKDVTVSGVGSIEAIGTIKLDAADITGGTVKVDSGGVLQVASTISSVGAGVSVRDSGSIRITSGAYLYLSSNITGSGSIAIDGVTGTNADLKAVGDVTLSGGGQVSMNVNGFITGYGSSSLTNADTITGGGAIFGSMTFTNSGSVDDDAGTMLINNQNGGGLINNGLIESTATGILSLKDVTVTGNGAITDDHQLKLDAATIESGSVTIGSAAIFEAIDGASSLGSGVSLTNDKTLEVISGSELTIAGAITNNGLVETAGTGDLTIDGAIAGSGSARLAGSGSLTINGAMSQAVVFASTATSNLVLGAASDFTGRISGLSTTGANAIDLQGVAYNESDTTSFSGGVLTIYSSSDAVLATLKLAGSFSGFALSDDGSGGTLIKDPPGSRQIAQAIANFGSGSGSGSGVGVTHAPAVVSVDRLLAAPGATG